MKCCICGTEINGYGNNPDGAVYKDENGEPVRLKFNAEDRCCDECNKHYVIPGRIYLRIYLSCGHHTESK